MRVIRVLTCGTVLAFATTALAADHEQLIRYYRKKANVPTAQAVTVIGLKDGAIAGTKEGSLQIGTPPRVQTVPFTMSADGRHVIFAAIEDVTKDPSKLVMEKIAVDGQPAKGPADAKVTIVEYSDFQCPFCSRGYDTIENQVLKQYGDKVRFYYKHFPLAFHQWAEAAAVSAECAKKQSADAYWKLYSGYFEQQKQITPETLKEKSHALLEGTGIDMAAFDACVDGKETLPAVKAQMAEGQSVGIRGTPGFIINGRLLSGAQPFEKFKTIIDDELASSQ